ncbi:hypothetical protein LTR54_017572 [Friedmanniomyces endolithicus]|nr:hypothetical protein LTS09_017504 [Friedmanniomyces endolithicus]KAK0972390.1 hypothetical protein LTR54_017572 [Friedmanniomyces endolithicus]
MDLEWHVGRAQTILGYSFADRETLIQALTASHSTEVEGRKTHYENNRRLAVLADTVLKLVLVQDWLFSERTLGRVIMDTQSSPADVDPGVLQGHQIRALSNQALSTIATQSGINACIIRSERQQYLPENAPATLYTAIKAVIGATWLDSGYDQAVVGHVIDTLQIFSPLMQEA